MADPSLLEAEQAKEAAPETPAPEVPVEEPPPQADEPETPKVEEPETEAEPAAEAEPTAGTPEESIEEKIRKAQIAEIEARAKHFESLAGKNAGELGFVRRQLQALQEQLLGQPRAESDNGEDAPHRPPPPPQPRMADPIAQWAVQQSIASALSQFRDTHPEFNNLASDVAKYLSDNKYDASTLFESADPVHAAREVSRSLEEAYWYVSAQHNARVRAELETKRADQVRNLHKAKLRGSPTPSGASPAPPVAKTLEDMSVDELRGLLPKG